MIQRPQKIFAAHKAYGTVVLSVTKRRRVGRRKLRRLARPASFGKNNTPLVGGPTQRTSGFESFIAFGPRRHLARKLKRVLGSLVPIQPIPIG
jgi:hypothetical protein